MKYLIPVNNVGENMAQIFREFPMRGGFYNWAKVMNADIRAYNNVEDLEKYDVVHCNMCPSDWWFALDAGRKLRNSSTKLVLNNDHVSEFWHKWNLDISLYQQVQKCGDLVFGTEPYQTSQMVDKAITMPHPTNIKDLKVFGNKFKESNKIGFLYHHYSNTNIQNVLLSKALKKDIKGVKTVLYNYVSPKNQNEKVVSEHWFDEVYKQFEFPAWCMSLMRNKIVMELAQYHTYGRASVETAALKIPTIGSDRIFSMKHNFPKLVCDPLNHRKIRELAKKVWNNSKFRKEQIDTAYQNCEYFNYKNSKERMMKALEGVKK